ncbi:MAG: ABC transporter permease [Cyanobacteria bacterium]|nr:ABC transporter permease [Cyanobacteriota bacterium]MDW8200171.1 ABC transporter permease [Cyanobacteriota bacterium SKYGB_h_bin112]
MVPTSTGARTFWQRLVYLRDLLQSLVDRDMKLLYKRSTLGVAWTLISPLLQLLVFIFIFGVIIKVDIPQYASYVFCGLLVWNWFNSSLFQATGVIINSRPLVRQPGFPVAMLPIAVTATGLVHLLLSLPVLMLFLLLDGVRLTPWLLCLPIIQLVQFALTISIAYVLAGLNVAFRDTQHTLGVVLQLLFYLTPIFYDLKSIPGKYWFFYGLNPMVHIVTWYRQILLWGVAPDWLAMAIVAVITLLLLPLGYAVFQRQSARFVEEL